MTRANFMSIPDSEQRDRIADDVLSALPEASLASEANLRGSLAEGGAGAYSDIDVLWEIENSDVVAFTGRLREVHATRSEADIYRSPINAVLTRQSRRSLFAQRDRRPRGPAARYCTR